MKLYMYVRGIQFSLILGFLIFTYIPFLSIVLFVVSLYFSTHELWSLLALIALTLGFGLVTIYGLLTLRLSYRGFGTLIFSIGIFFHLNDAYLLSLSVIITWLFYEFWGITAHYNQLDKEYCYYHSRSIEMEKLMDIFRIQSISLGILTWITLLISWGILMIANNFFVEIGKESGFGTLGISISLGVIIFLYLIQQYITPVSRSRQLGDRE